MKDAEIINRFQQCQMRDHPLRKAVLENLKAYTALRVVEKMRADEHYEILMENARLRSDNRDLQFKIKELTDRVTVS